MEEIILTGLKGIIMVSVLKVIYLTISTIIPEMIQFNKEEKMTVEARMDLRKSRGEL